MELLKDIILSICQGINRWTSLDIERFGWLYSLLYSNKIDMWQRYQGVAKKINALGSLPLTILDVGAQYGVVGEFIDAKKHNIYILDIDCKSIKYVKNKALHKIIGNGCLLPFKNNSFDIVISIDTLQYIPCDLRNQFYNEVKRVTKSFFILHCPCDSIDNIFQGTEYDRKLLDWYEQRHKKDEFRIRKYLKNIILPRTEDLIQVFDNASLSGKQNVDVWFIYMKRQFTRYLKRLNGLLYAISLHKKDDTPPYHACILVWKKSNDI